MPYPSIQIYSGLAVLHARRIFFSGCHSHASCLTTMSAITVSCTVINSIQNTGNKKVPVLFAYRWEIYGSEGHGMPLGAWWMENFGECTDASVAFWATWIIYRMAIVLFL